jgi:hypothetical protein
MDTSDPIPRGGQPYIAPVPEETKNANTVELRQAEQALPFVDGVSAWFDEQIAQTDSIEYALSVKARYADDTDPILIAMNVLKDTLVAKKGEFDSLKLTFEK